MIVGLGNPGERYAHSRHNAGFMLVESLAAAHAVALRQQRHGALLGKARIGSRRCLLALPQTFMNRSGEPVQRLLGFSGLGVESLVVAHDDLDLPLGRLRLRRGGGAGGHRGVASILDQLGEAQFVRLKIGISRPPQNVPAEAYVLQDFDALERVPLAGALERGVAAIETLLARGLQAAMNCCNPVAPPPGGDP